MKKTHKALYLALALSLSATCGTVICRGIESMTKPTEPPTPSRLIISVASGQLITVTAGAKRRTCGGTSYYSTAYTNATGPNGYFQITEPFRVLAWTDSSRTVPVNYPMWASRHEGLLSICTTTRTTVDPSPAGGGTYNYRFEILSPTNTTVYVEIDLL